jgi:hypothetical protein
MTLDTLSLLLPILWALIATVVGLLLYKTSEALFESKQKDETGTKRLRLLGSVTIAALAFYGMKYATPSERLRAAPIIPEGSIVLKRNDVENLHGLTVKLDRSSLDLQGCLTTLDAADCREKIVEVQ